MQRQRFELKYIISEETALKARDFVRSYMDLDEYSAVQPDLSYPVHSLYLDSDDLRTYWETINGDKNRFKLRLRYYSTDPQTPVFFEIKRRVNNCIMKQRGGVKQHAVEHLLAGHLPDKEHLVSYTDRAQTALIRFCELLHRIQAKPRVHIAYFREAYVSDNDAFRVTMDRKVRAEPNLHFSIKTEMKNPQYSFHPGVILELKFTDRYPDWFRELVRVLNVMQRGAAKYVMSIQKVGHLAVGCPFPVVNEEDLALD